MGTSGKQRYGSLEGSAVGIAVRKWFLMMSLDAGQEVDWLTKMVCRAIYYTAGNNNRFRIRQLHWHSRKIQKKDPLLKKWKKYSSLIKEQDIGWLGEFRDPFVWIEQDNYFYAGWYRR